MTPSFSDLGRLKAEEHDALRLLFCTEYFRRLYLLKNYLFCCSCFCCFCCCCFCCCCFCCCCFCCCCCCCFCCCCSCFLAILLLVYRSIDLMSVWAKDRWNGCRILGLRQCLFFCSAETAFRLSALKILFARGRAIFPKGIGKNKQYR